MIYENILAAKFLSRPNRFVANIEIDGEKHVCHVKNTGRCRELLIPGADIFVQKSENPARKTKFDLISVYKGERLVNIDSQIPNKVFEEWIRDGNLYNSISSIRPECKYGSSRFDFYIEADGKQTYVEVKGVTLELGKVAMFPDAPTERGVKHINELKNAVSEGYSALIVFIIQMENVKYFTPNVKTHKAFADALKDAYMHGVKVLALDCQVTANSIVALNEVEVRL
ncbi:MAG: DNA/RNA nuclease SfsA [Eubacteriales bacterium]|nr:DNA/RNA nuclease SfsA [Eubacteriales bacterium]